MSTRGPRPLAGAIEELSSRLAPGTPLSGAQGCWDRVTGPAIAAAARPASERGGVLTVICESAAWAQELELMADELVARLNAELGAEVITALRCRSA